MAEKSDMEKAVEGGAEFISKQQAKVAADLAKEEAREAAAAAAAGYPRTFDRGTRMVDETNGHEFVGTQWSFNTEAEALAKINEARASNKYVMYANPDGGSYINALSADDFRVNIED